MFKPGRDEPAYRAVFVRGDLRTFLKTDGPDVTYHLERAMLTTTTDQLVCSSPPESLMTSGFSWPSRTSTVQPRSSVYIAAEEELRVGNATYVTLRMSRRPRQEHDLYEFLRFARALTLEGQCLYFDHPSQLPTLINKGIGGRVPDFYTMPCIVHSIGNRTGLKLGNEATGSRDVFPFIIGPHETIRYIYSSLPSRLQTTYSLEKALPVRENYQSLSHLWMNVGNCESPDTALARCLWDPDVHDAFTMGNAMGDLHNRNLRHTDAHRSNFISNEAMGRAAAIDLDDGELKLLCRPATVEECATDLAPFLLSCEPPEWRVFRLGYRQYRHQEGVKVIAFIQLGPNYLEAVRAGWNVPRQNDLWGSQVGRDDTKALHLLDKVISDRRYAPTEERMVLLKARSLLLHRVGRADEGFEVAKVALDVAARISLQSFAKYALHLAELQLHCSARDSAKVVLASVLARSDELARWPELISRTRRLISNLDKQST